MSEVQPLLREPRQRVSARAPLVWAAVGLLQALGVGVVLGVLTWAWHLFTVPAAGWAAYVVVSLSYVVTMPLLRYRTHRWETTATAVYTQVGWLTRERRIAPMSRVQTVDLSQGPVSRLLGLAGVTVTTASAAGPLRIDGLARPVADRLVAELTRRTEADPGDAT